MAYHEHALMGDDKKVPWQWMHTFIKTFLPKITSVSLSGFKLLEQTKNNQMFLVRKHVRITFRSN